MAFDLNRLLEKAFFVTEVTNANQVLEQASRKYLDLHKAAGMSFEVAPPRAPDESWAKERLLRPLVYYCESSGRTLPECRGTYLAMFIGNRFHAVAVDQVIAWAREELGLGAEELHEMYGTHEAETALR